jgi:hypothetical protein
MRQRAQKAAWLVALSLLLAACSSTIGGSPPTTGSIVDGFPLGPLLHPTPPPDVQALAADALDKRMSGHAAILSASAYQEDIALVYGPDAARSGTMTVYVFKLADASYHAAGVYCGVGGCTPWPVYRP